MRLLIIILILITSLDGLAQPERGSVRSGNRAYKKGDTERAEVDYRRALEKNPESLFARYNLGNAVFKNGRAEEASNIVKGLDSLADEPLKASIYHNLGNYSLDQKKYQEAVEQYKSSLRINPSDLETKSNLAYAQKMLKREQDKNQDQNKDNQDQNKDNQDENKDNKDQNKDNEEQNRENQNQKQPQITPQSAQQMLQAIQNKERETQEKVNRERAKALQGRQKEKNW